MAALFTVVATGIFLAARKKAFGPGEQRPDGQELSLQTWESDSDLTARAALEGVSPADRIPENGSSRIVALPAMDATSLTEIESKANATLIMEATSEYWRAEDEMLAQMPSLDSVREIMRQRASDILMDNGVSPESRGAVIAAAQGQLDRFWESGGLTAPRAYENAYVARAMLEMALETNPDDFQLLCALSEAIGSVSPLHRGNYMPNRDSVEALWPVVDKLHGMVMSGKVAPSEASMGAMCDWLALSVRRVKPAEAAPTWEWLVSQSAEGGWSGIRQDFEEGLRHARDGRTVLPTIYIVPGKDGLKQFKSLLAKEGRRLPSFRGSPERRGVLVPLWRPDAGLTIIRSTVTATADLRTSDP